jgi:hypothetical protein
MGGNDGLLAEERQLLLDLIETRGVGLVATELCAPYHEVVDAALGDDDVDDKLVDSVRRLLAK